jgi:hypothetical protein
MSFSTFLGYLGNFASVVGGVSSLVVWRALNRIKREYRERAMLPRRITKLGKISSELVRNLTAWEPRSLENLRLVAELNAMLDAVAADADQSIKPLLRATRQRTNRRSALMRIAGFKDKPLSEQQANHLCAELSGLLKALDERVKTSKWRI